MEKELSTLNSTPHTHEHSHDHEPSSQELRGSSHHEHAVTSEPKSIDMKYWRSMDQLADTPEYQNFLHREFPSNASELTDPVTRRNFMKVMGASVALAGLASCRMPKEKIVPYVKSPENVIPGKPKFYASTFAFADHAYGVLVESHEGRPTKIEGNDVHPTSLGGTHPWALASVLSLYDPDRSKTPTLKGAPSSWNQFEQDWRTWSTSFAASKGKGLAILSESFDSLTMGDLADDFKKKYPNATWVSYEPVSQENAAAGHNMVTGKKHKLVHNLDKANVIVAVDSDFLMIDPLSVRYTKDFSKRRKVLTPADKMNRLYSVESTMSSTGAMADHRLPIASSQIPHFLIALYKQLQKFGLPDLANLPTSLQGLKLRAEHSEWISALAKDLKNNLGKSVLMVGAHQSPEVHAIAYAINYGLGAFKGIIEAIGFGNYQSNSADLKKLAEQNNEKEIQTLVILGSNPAYNTPADRDFAKLSSQVQNTVH